MVILFGLLILIILAIIFLNPKLGSFLIWPILFTYPHGWWFFNGFLPFNIGYDDLFCVALFLVVLIRRNLMGGVPLRFGYSFWVISSFMLVVTVAVISGAMSHSGVYWPMFLKEIFKTGIFWCLFYAILQCVDNERDLKIQFFMFSLAAVLGAGILIFQYFFPSMAWAWQLPEVSTLIGQHIGTVQEDVESRRAYGAFMNANGAACVIGISLILLMGVLRLQKTIFSKTFCYGLCFILLIAILLTKSRSGFLMLGLTILLMAFFSQNRKIPWLMIAAGALVFALFTDTRTAFMERVSDIYNPTTKAVSDNVEGRIGTWKSYFETADLKTFVFGQGNTAGVLRNKMESHSMYVALVTVYGIGGVVWAVALYGGFIKRARYAKHSDNLFLSHVATGCLWAIFAFSVYAGTSDALSSNYSRYLLFYIIVLTDRAFEIARQEEVEKEQVDQDNIYLDEGVC